MMSCEGLVGALYRRQMAPKCPECKAPLEEDPRYWHCPECGCIKVK